MNFFDFEQQTHYCAQTPKRKRTEKQTIVKKIVCVRIQNVYEIVNAGIEVPVLAPSDLTTNNIINVSYHISVCKLGLELLSTFNDLLSISFSDKCINGILESKDSR